MQGEWATCEALAETFFIWESCLPVTNTILWGAACVSDPIAFQHEATAVGTECLTTLSIPQPIPCLPPVPSTQGKGWVRS